MIEHRCRCPRRTPAARHAPGCRNTTRREVAQVQQIVGECDMLVEELSDELSLTGLPAEEVAQVKRTTADLVEVVQALAARQHIQWQEALKAERERAAYLERSVRTLAIQNEQVLAGTPAATPLLRDLDDDDPIGDSSSDDDDDFFDTASHHDDDEFLDLPTEGAVGAGTRAAAAGGAAAGADGAAADANAARLARLNRIGGDGGDGSGSASLEASCEGVDGG